jgi:hypothetical protein
MSSLDAVLAQYEKSKQASGGSQSKMSQDERMKKYFALILEDKEKTGSRKIRILPTPDGSSPFKEAWYHEIQVGGKWQKFYDPGKNDNERSPLNEVYEELISTGKESEKGRDLIIELSKSKTGNGKDYTTVQTIMYDDPTPVHEEAEQAKAWVNDELTWLDVYSKKPVEYLEAIARGEVPRWDTDKGGYVYGNDEEGTTSIGGSKKTVIDIQADEEPDGDLPF